ncbi:MAG TPA: class I SAM-dependent methyltransferase [Desulfurivibrionaceae bacterium]|nr:class I SAM-dependent methyltransferase [Desulfurivibrionaceae bacterium]
MKNRIATPLIADQDGVWHLTAPQPFAYSDGAATERYLQQALATATDLASDSAELAAWIRDWPSEYHLSPKRAQLLKGFQFDRAARVLEVGCGCGAITRFLGETFGEVLSIEGSPVRARLARKRTREQPGVTIVCAPFQELVFTAGFDVIFCIGVLEYAGSYLSAPDPYQDLLARFAQLLNPGGVLFVAIENQFGLKYFAGSREDHTGIRFEGIEGYPRRGHRVRTFGHQELKDRLAKEFGHIDSYFPYPDYKLPDCVVTEEFLRTGTAGELVGLLPLRDEDQPLQPVFQDKLALLELDRNRQLPFFANSFLLVASKEQTSTVSFPQAGILFSRGGRLPQFQTLTRFLMLGGTIEASKTLVKSAQPWSQSGRLRCHPKRETWRNGLTLHTRLLQRLQRRDLSLAELFAPARPWLALLDAQSRRDLGRITVPGTMLDAIWHNLCVDTADHAPHCIDQEWEWTEPLGRNVLVIRAIFRFLEEGRTVPNLTPLLRRGSTRTLITRIAASLDIPLSPADFREFVALESEVLSLVTGRSQTATRRSIVRILAGTHVVFMIHREVIRLSQLAASTKNRIARWRNILSR